MKKIMLLLFLVVLSLALKQTLAQDIAEDGIDTEPPVITLLGNNPDAVEVTATYLDAGAIATDNYDGDLTSSIITTNAVNPAIPGEYIITYSVTDSSGNSVSLTRTINILDITTPTLADSESDTISFTDDTPLVSLPSSTTVITQGATFTIQATISSTSPMNQVVVSFETVDYNMTPLGNSGTYELTLNAAQLPQDLGAYTYYVIAINENGNIGSSASTLEIKEPSIFTQVLGWLIFWD